MSDVPLASPEMQLAMVRGRRGEGVARRIVATHERIDDELERPAVLDDVVDGEQQRVLRRAEAQQAQALQRRRVERHADRTLTLDRREHARLARRLRLHTGCSSMGTATVTVAAASTRCSG